MIISIAIVLAFSHEIGIQLDSNSINNYLTLDYSDIYVIFFENQRSFALSVTLFFSPIFEFCIKF